MLARTPVIDGHNDTPEQLRTLYGNDFTKFDLNALPPEAIAKTHTSLGLLRKGQVGGQFWSVWVDPALPRFEAVVQVLEQIDTVKRMAIAYPETLTLATSADEVVAAMAKHRIASLIGMEGGYSIANSLAVLRQMYGAGARYMTLTHWQTIDWADSATDAARHDGLTRFGVAVVHEMNRLGMLVDLSHVSEATMNDALDASAAPVIFSHSAARAIDPHPRNVPDSVLARLKANGGVVMVVFLPDFINPAVRDWEAAKAGEAARLKSLNPGDPARAEAGLADWGRATPRPVATVAQVADHIDHIRKVAGIDHIGLGGDFGGMSSTPVGLENVGAFPVLFTELARRGYSRDDLGKIAQGNILRVLRAAEGVAASQRALPPSDAQIAP